MKGKIYKREGKRGISYRTWVELPPDPQTGKRRQKLLTAPTKKELEALAAQMIVSVANGGFAEADAKKMTVSTYLTRWVSTLEQTVRPSTQRRYTDILNKHVEPVIGRVHLAKLSPLDVQRLYADRLAAGLSPTTVNLIHCVLHRALKQAVRWGLLTRNVTEAVDPPREATPEYSTWNKEQAAAFLAVADQHEWAALWRLALLTGMRRGEMLGLQWGDIDLAKSAISVQRTQSRASHGGFEFGQPKTKHGRRQIALPQSVVESLKTHRRKQVETRLKVGAAYTDLGMVFADVLGRPLHPNTVNYQFHSLIRKANLPRLRIHDIRHTSATLMLANNVHPKIVSERLGHANIGITLDRYSHVTAQMQQEAAAQLDALLEDAI